MLVEVIVRFPRWRRCPGVFWDEDGGAGHRYSCSFEQCNDQRLSLWLCCPPRGSLNSSQVHYYSIKIMVPLRLLVFVLLSGLRVPQSNFLSLTVSHCIIC